MPPIVADWLTPSAVCAKLKRRAPRVGGMLRWAQILLAQELCDLGIWIDKQELGDAEQRARENLAPHWTSRATQRRAKPIPPLFPTEHKVIDFTALSKKDRKLPGRGKLGKGPCAGCLVQSEEAPGEDGLWWSPGGHTRRVMPGGGRVPAFRSHGMAALPARSICASSAGSLWQRGGGTMWHTSTVCVCLCLAELASALGQAVSFGGYGQRLREILGDT